ncbi:Transposase, ISC1217 [Sulfolobus islandicus L.S.2.15]|uniref:Transposase, ISC1217 n=1 Tax=Saccharolobus islandicus (strain L.S.2.15 / Lassen \
MNKNLSNDAYYQALNDAIYAALAPLEDIRKDSAIRLLLGGIIGKGTYKISQEMNMDYMTLLKNLDKIANLMKAVKNIVKNHPVILIIDDTHDHKQYAIPTSRNATQAYHRKVHKKYEPANTNNCSKGLENKRNLHTLNNTIHTTKGSRNIKGKGEKVEFKTKIQAYLEI